MTIAVITVSCKTAELNALTKKVEVLEKKNQELKNNLTQQTAIAKKSEAKAVSALEQLQQHSQIAGDQAAQAQRFQMEAERTQIEVLRARELYEKCAQKKSN